jgi:hypothetical protein
VAATLQGRKITGNEAAADQRLTPWMLPWCAGFKEPRRTSHARCEPLSPLTMQLPPVMQLVAGPKAMALPCLDRQQNLPELVATAQVGLGL